MSDYEKVRSILNQRNSRIKISPFNLEDIEEVLKLIYETIEVSVSRSYSSEVISGLKSLYTFESVTERKEDPLTEIWVARNLEDEINFIMSITEYQKEPNKSFVESNPNKNLQSEIPIDFNLNGLEIKTFYGLCPKSFMKMLDKAKERTVEKDLVYLTGVVIKSGWKGFTKCGGRGGSLYYSEPFEVIEINKKTKKKFSFETRYFNFIHREIMQMQEDIGKYARIMS